MFSNKSKVQIIIIIDCIYIALYTKMLIVFLSTYQCIITLAMPGYPAQRGAQGKRSTRNKFLPVPIYYAWVERGNCG